MYYNFGGPPPSIVVLERHSLFVHQCASPLPPLRHFLRIEVTRSLFVGSRTSDCSTVWAPVSCRSATCIRSVSQVWSPLIFESVDMLVQALDILFLRSNCVNQDRQTCRQFSEWTPICYRLGCGGGNFVEVTLKLIKHIIRQWGWRGICSRFM